MNILILGSGGREHSLAWAVMQNPKCDRLIVAPGNAGIAAIADCAALDILDGDAVVSFATENAIDLVIVGPEAPLEAGVSDACRAAGLVVFGPSAAAAQLEPPNLSQKRSATRRMLLQQPGPGLPMPLRRMTMWRAKAPPSSSRRTGLPRAKA